MSTAPVEVREVAEILDHLRDRFDVTVSVKLGRLVVVGARAKEPVAQVALVTLELREKSVERALALAETERARLAEERRDAHEAGRKSLPAREKRRTLIRRSRRTPSARTAAGSRSPETPRPPTCVPSSAPTLEAER